MKEYDIIVIGAGAGTKLVTPPSLIGKKVAIFEKESPGGTCLNRGCIPSKMVIYPSEILRLAEESKKFPLFFPEAGKADTKAIFQRVTETVKKDSDSIPLAYEKNPNIDFYSKEVQFKSNKIITDGENDFTAKHIFIVTGTRPQIPKINGLNNTEFWTSRDALNPQRFPKSMIIIGAGFISLELGSAYMAYGCQVQGLTRTEILRGIDSEVRSELKKNLPFPIEDHFSIESVDQVDTEFIVTGKNKKAEIHIYKSEALLVATGITPNTDSLGLGKTDIQTNELGYIKVNEYLETNVKDVYAFGDVIGKFFFRHSANFEGEFLFDNLFIKESPTPIEYPPMPSAVFTHPQIASIGLTEDELILSKRPYWKGVNPYASSAMGMARMSNSGFVKILVCQNTETVLGAHIIGDEASNMIHQLVLGMSLKAKLEDYLNMIYIHPAISEIVRNAFRKIKIEKLKGRNV